MDGLEIITTMTSPLRGLAAVLLAIALMAGCTGYWKPRVAERPVAEQGVALFHKRLNDQQFDDIRQSIELSSREATKLIDFIRSFREKYGSFVSTEQTIAYCAPQGVEFLYHTQYSNGDTTELFSWNVYGGVAHLRAYSVSSAAVEIPMDLHYVCPDKKDQ